MQACSGEEITPELQDLAQRVARWQRRRVGRERMPEELWEKTLAVASRWGAYRTARFLGLCSSTVRRRLEAQGSRGAASEEGPFPEFVELFTPALGGRVAGCVLNLQTSGGTHLRVEVQEITPQGLLTVLRGLVA